MPQVPANQTQRLRDVREELKDLYDRSAVTHLTADNARAVAISLGYSIGNWLGSVFREGFTAIGIAKSNVKTRKGGLIRTWIPA